MSKNMSADFEAVLGYSAHRVQPRAEIWRKDLETGVDELRASNLIIESEGTAYTEMLDEGLVKGQLSVQIYDPVGSLFPYSVDSPTSFLGNRIIFYLDASCDAYKSGQVFTMKLGEFYIDGSPDGTVPLPRQSLDIFGNPQWEHVGGKIKLNAVDHLSNLAKDTFVLPLRALSQPATTAISRITKDYDWSTRGLPVNNAGIIGDNVEFEVQASQNGEASWGTCYPETLSDAVRIVMQQTNKVAFTDENGTLCFRERGDNEAFYKMRPSDRLIKQNLKMSFNDVFNGILVEDTNSEEEYNQRAFYKMETNPLMRWGRFKRILKKQSVEEVPNSTAALKAMQDSVNESGKLVLTTAYLALGLSAGDQVVVNPRIGQVLDRVGIVRELSHDFSEGTTDVEVGYLPDDLIDCPDLGHTYEITGADFNRKI